MVNQVRPSSYVFFPWIDSYLFHYNETKHFLLTQLQTLVFAMIITTLMQLSNHLAIYLVYLCPVYFLIVIIEHIIFWKLYLGYRQFFIFNLVLLIVCTPIFFGVFFGIFHPTASLEFKQVQNCQMVGSLGGAINRYERYEILYVNFELDGEQYLGAACSSDQNQGSTTSAILPYRFYYKYDAIRNKWSDYLNSSICDDLEVGCDQTYYWSKVKIASWVCLKSGFDLEKFQEKQSCYVNFFGGSKAVQNGLQRSAMKDEQYFPLISYYPTPYYPKDQLICFIVFFYYFWLLSFRIIFYKTSDLIIDKIYSLQRSMENIVHKQQNWQDYD